MATVLLVIHLMIAAALVGVVLVQRSEGGALGIGGGGGGGGFLTGRGTANLLTRTTAGLAAAFFVTSILLTVMAQKGPAPRSLLDQPAASATEPAKKEGEGTQPARGGVLDALQGGRAGERLPAVPGTK
jgi:preprotein translocase subunit SecG